MALTKKKTTKSKTPKKPNLKLAKSDEVKASPKRGRGRPAGSKNKTKKSTARKTSSTNKTRSQTQNNNSQSSQTQGFSQQGSEMMNAAMQSGSRTAEMAKKMSEEMVKFSNDSFSKNMELSREFFGCRTLSDMFEVQNKMMKQNVDRFFKQSSKMTEMMFKASGKTGAPLNTSFTDMADTMAKQFKG